VHVWGGLCACSLHGAGRIPSCPLTVLPAAAAAAAAAAAVAVAVAGAVGVAGVDSGGEAFTASGSVLLRPGFTAIMPWKVRRGRALAACVLQLLYECSI
jgi:hypothetical protein